MPAIIGIPNVVQFLIKGTWASGHNTANSFHLRSGNAGPYSVGDLTLLASEVSSQWGTNLMPHLSDQLSMVEVLAVDRSVSDGNQAQDDTVVAGGAASPPAPLNTSMLYQWADTSHYRGGHPRNYVPGITQGDILNGHAIVGASKAVLDGAMTTFLTNVLAGGPYGTITPLTWVAAHYRRNKVVLPVPTASTITPLAFSPELSTQRRRLRKAAHS